jgi:hypothetical protein
MSHPPVEVITSVERRQRWSATEKERLIAASLEAGRGRLGVGARGRTHPTQLYVVALCTRRPALCGGRRRRRRSSSTRPIGPAFSQGLLFMCECQPSGRPRLVQRLDLVERLAQMTFGNLDVGVICKLSQSCGVAPPPSP